jgi:hypothetical protein
MVDNARQLMVFVVKSTLPKKENYVDGVNGVNGISVMGVMCGYVWVLSYGLEARLLVAKFI